MDLRDQLDGYRCIAVKRGQEVTLFSRHKKVLNRRFPGVVEAFASLEADFVSMSTCRTRLTRSSLISSVPTQSFAVASDILLRIRYK